MSANLDINGVTYPGVEEINAVDENGKQVTYYKDAVLYKEQTLTEEQKAQARENMGLTVEEWTFTLEDGTEVTKKVVLA